MSKKPLISKRFFTNLLIILFGIFVLIVAVITTLRVWYSASASSVTILDYGIPYPLPTYQYSEVTGGNGILNRGYLIRNVENRSYLEVYQPEIIASNFPDQKNAPPTYLLTYYVVGEENGAPSTQGNFAVLPLTNYDYTKNLLASEDSVTFKLLTYAKNKSAALNILGEIETITGAYNAYVAAATYSRLTYRVVPEGNVHYLYDRDPAFSDNQGDVDVQTVNAFPGIDGSTWALKISIEPGTDYNDPKSDSLALSIMDSALSEADGYGDTANKDLIQAAITEYQRQIESSNENQGLSIQSVDSVNYNETQSITFKVDFSQLPIPTNGHLGDLRFKIKSVQICSVIFGTGGTGGNFDQGVLYNPDNFKCSWSNDSKQGTFIWEGTTGTPEQKISTKDPEVKNLALQAFSAGSDAKKIAEVNKSVTVLPDYSDEPTPNDEFGLILTTPNSIYRPDGTNIKVSATNLQQHGSPVARLAWYACVGSQTEIQGNDSTGCVEKGLIPSNDGKTDLTGSENLEQSVQWSTSGSALGIHVIMLKAFGPKVGGTFPYIDGSKTVSHNILITNIAKPGDGGGGGGTVKPPQWAANFAQSGITSIKEFLGRLGGFTLTILGALAVLAIIIAGMKYITSGGDEKKAEVGKRGVLFAVYGIIAAVLSVQLISITIDEVKKIFTIIPAPDSTESIEQIVPTTLLKKGPNLELADIFNQSGLIWHIIRLAALYAEAVAIFFILYASFLYLTSYGDESKAESAKKTMIWAIIGLAVVIAANYLLAVFAEVII